MGSKQSSAIPATETRLLRGKFEVSLTLADLPAHETPDPPTANFIICLALRGRMNASFRFGYAWRTAQINPGMFLPVTPPETLGEFRFTAPHRHLILSLPSAPFGAESDLRILHDAPFHEPFLASLCRRLWHDAAQPLEPLYVDSATSMLAGALARRARQRVAAPIAPLSDTQWMRVMALIENQSSFQLTVADLAHAAQCSESRLLRGFKARVGLTPHRFILARRLERARALLNGSNLPISEIALVTGFYDQAHFSTAFARHFGLTPGASRAFARTQ